MDEKKTQKQAVLGTLVNEDASGIIAYSDQIYDKKEEKSVEDIGADHENRVKQLETWDGQLQGTIENITKTGEASAAENVTYNHNDSKLNASNIQQAIDEVYSKGNSNIENTKEELNQNLQNVYKKSNYNDGDEVVDFNTIHLLKDNPTWFLLLVDANNKFIYGITHKDAQPHWGVGIPKVIKTYVDEQINKILGVEDVTAKIDSLKEIEAFLEDFSNSDTLKQLLDSQTEDIEDKYKRSNPNDDEGNVVDTNTLLSVKNSNNFITILCDIVGKVLETINLQGIHKFFAGIDIQGSLHFVTTNPKFIWMLLDSDDKFIVGIDKKTGSPKYGVGIPTQIKEYVDTINNDFSYKLKQINELIASILDNISVRESNGNILFTDSSDKVLLALGLNNENKSFLPINIQGSVFKVSSNNKFFLLLLDKDDRAIFWITTEGEVNWAKGVPQVIQKWVNTTISDKLYDPNDAVERNSNRMPALQNACRQQYSSSSSSLKKDFQLEIVTDSHGTTKAVSNAVSFCNSFKTIDALIHCGDIAVSNGWNERGYITDTLIPEMKKCNKPWFVVIGNHDVGNTPYVYYGVTHEDAYAMYIKPMIDSGILAEGEYQEGKCYYYHDFTDKKLNQKIRLIILYEYDNPLDVDDNDYWKVIDYDSSYPQLSYGQYDYDENNPIRVNCSNYKEHSFELKQSVFVKNYVRMHLDDDEKSPYFKLYRGAELIRQEQAEWFRDTLLSTPKGYGIVIAMHNVFSKNTVNQKSYKFADNSKDSIGGQFYLTDDLIANVANAYNNKTTLEEKIVVGTYNGHDGSYLNTKDDGDGTKYYYKLSCDFASAEATILGFVGGHVHTDLIAKHNTYNIWGINPTCANTNSANVYGDVAKDDTDDLAFDSITTTSWYGTRIALCRIGNMYSKDGKIRDIEIINTYK